MTPASRRSAASTNRSTWLANIRGARTTRHVEDRRQGTPHCARRFGKSASPENLPITGLYSRGWYDDVSDGSVRATLNLKGTDARQSVEPAWVLIGVSRFAEPISAIVTMYDLAYDVATRLPAPNTLVPPTEVSFTRDIYPVLFRAVMMRWVISTARMGHGSGAGGDFLESHAVRSAAEQRSDTGISGTPRTRTCHRSSAADRQHARSFRRPAVDRHQACLLQAMGGGRFRRRLGGTTCRPAVCCLETFATDPIARHDRIVDRGRRRLCTWHRGQQRYGAARHLSAAIPDQSDAAAGHPDGSPLNPVAGRLSRLRLELVAEWPPG